MLKPLGVGHTCECSIATCGSSLQTNCLSQPRLALSCCVVVALLHLSTVIGLLTAPSNCPLCPPSSPISLSKWLGMSAHVLVLHRWVWIVHVLLSVANVGQIHDGSTVMATFMHMGKSCLHANHTQACMCLPVPSRAFGPNRGSKPFGATCAPPSAAPQRAAHPHLRVKNVTPCVLAGVVLSCLRVLGHGQGDERQWCAITHLQRQSVAATLVRFA